MSKGWLKAIAETPALREAVAIAGLCDLDLGQAEARAAEFAPEAITGSDLDAMLAELKPDLLFDVVIPQARRGVVETALRHGCHVLSEKPMAASLEEARDLVAAAARAGRMHAVVQNRRYNPGVRRLHRMIAEGTLGEITSLNCDFFVGAHFGGFREQMRNVLLLDMAIHTFDAARFMSGKTPEAVYCLETNPRGSWNLHGAAANAVFEFSDGVVFNYRGSWVAEGANTNWDSSWRIIGTRGTVLWDGAEGFSAGLVAGSDGFFRPIVPAEVPPPAEPSQTLGHASVLSAFVAAVESGSPPETASFDNIKSLAMVFAAIESGASKSRVLIKP